MKLFLVLLLLLATETKLTLSVDKEALPATLSKNLQPLLAPQSFRVNDASGQALLTFWIRKEIPLEATKDQIENGVTYREVVPGSLIGCLEVHQQWTDFRKQTIKPGVYTLRLAIQPMTGDHEGTAPHQDFCLLCPVEKDISVEAVGLEKLVQLSSKVTGTAHPSVMLLFPVKKLAELKEPKLEEPMTSVQTLVLVRDAAAEKMKTQIGFAFTVEGVRKD